MNLSKEKVRDIILILVIGIGFYWILQNFSTIANIVRFVLHLFLPFLIGGAIAFILNIPMKNIEKLLFENVKKESRLFRFKRIISYFITLILVIAVLFLVVVVVMPQLILTIESIAKAMPSALVSLQKQMDLLMQGWPDFVKVTEDININWAEVTNKILTILRGGLTTVLDSSFSIIGNVVGAVVNIVIAFIFSIYILMQKEKLGVQVKKVLYALFSEKMVDRLLYLGRLSSRTFSNFFSGQCLEACILGALFFISMSIFKFPYELLISVLLAFTALIPIVGSFIGCVISALLIATLDPIQALEFVVMFLIIQQIEGNLIYPHVVGSSVGLPSIWVLVAVTVGGNLFGIVGILLFIPLSSVFYTLFRLFITKKLQKKKISSEKWENIS